MWTVPRTLVVCHVGVLWLGVSASVAAAVEQQPAPAATPSVSSTPSVPTASASPSTARASASPSAAAAATAPPSPPAPAPASVPTPSPAGTAWATLRLGPWAPPAPASSSPVPQPVIAPVASGPPGLRPARQAGSGAGAPQTVCTCPRTLLELLMPGFGGDAVADPGCLCGCGGAACGAAGRFVLVRGSLPGAGADTRTGPDGAAGVVGVRRNSGVHAGAVGLPGVDPQRYPVRRDALGDGAGAEPDGHGDGRRAARRADAVAGRGAGGAADPDRAALRTRVVGSLSIPLGVTLGAAGESVGLAGFTLAGLVVGVCVRRHARRAAVPRDGGRGGAAAVRRGRRAGAPRGRAGAAVTG